MIQFVFAISRLCACWALIVYPSLVQAAPETPTDKDRLDAVVQFAETDLDHGRDTYGEIHTPLITDYIRLMTHINRVSAGFQYLIISR